MELVITDRMLERLVYWVIIVVLIILLALTYFHTSACQTATNATTSTGGTVTPPPINTTTNTTQQPVASCSDGIKNQDETDVDCGGLTCPACAELLRCVKNTDCAKGTCVAGICNATVASAPAPTGLAILGVDYTVDNTSKVTRVTGFTVRAQNGNPAATAFKLEAYVKTSDNNYYIDQGASANGAAVVNATVAYAAVTLPSIPSGQGLQQKITLITSQYVSGAIYLIPTTDNLYLAGDDFLLEMRLIDPTNGTVLVTTTRKVYLS